MFLRKIFAEQMLITTSGDVLLQFRDQELKTEKKILIVISSYFQPSMFHFL